MFRYIGEKSFKELHGYIRRRARLQGVSEQISEVTSLKYNGLCACRQKPAHGVGNRRGLAVGRSIKVARKGQCKPVVLPERMG